MLTFSHFSLFFFLLKLFELCYCIQIVVVYNICFPSSIHNCPSDTSVLHLSGSDLLSVNESTFLLIPYLGNVVLNGFFFFSKITHGSHNF